MSAPEKINNLPNGCLKVLVAPLDWGLGHATRCIPIIKELNNQRCEVIIAASGAQKALLEEEFPSLTFVKLPGYGIKYGKNRAFTILRLLLSIPKILIRIKREKAWLRRFATQERPDLVISDNRYGLVAPGSFCVFMTHQLMIRTPFGGWADRILQNMNYRAIGRFSRCWVPDEEEKGGLAGDLSHPRRMPGIPVSYIGLLSRFEGDRKEMAGEELLVLLSGPEPQRTILERCILEQARDWGGRMILVRGLPGGGGAPDGIPSGVTVYDHLPAPALEKVIRTAACVIARPGFSTLMDLVKVGKMAIYIPTPGQTEQEYLGRHLAERGWGICRPQRGFSLVEALVAAKAGRTTRFEGSPGRLADEIGRIRVLLGASPGPT